MNDDIKEILYILKVHDALADEEDTMLLNYITNLQQENEKLNKENEKWYAVAKDFEMEAHDLWNKNNELEQENERLKQNQVKALNRIRDFINSSKCEITEGSYCDDKHSQYWEMFKQYAEELQNKIKEFDTKDYFYIPKWREQELLSQEEQLEYYKSRIEKAVEYIKEHTTSFGDIFIPASESWYLSDILNGRSDE